MKKLNLISRLALLTLAMLLPGMALGQASAPASLTAASCAGQSFLSWPASAGAASYDVQRASASGGPYTLLANVGSGTLTYADTAVTNGGEYYYVVAAVSNGVAGANSPEAAAIPLAGGDYTIANRVSGLALDSAGSVADQQNYTGVNQLWQLVPFGHFYEIINAGNNLALSGPTASAQLTLSSFTENLDQLWLLEVTNGSSYLIYNVNTSQAMDDFNSSLTNGATIGQWDYDGGQNQNWTPTQILPPQIQSPALTNFSQFSEATVSALVNPNTLPTTVIIQFGTNTAYGQAVTNTFAATNSYQSVSDNFDYPIIDVTTLHALITASNAAGTVTSGDITGSSALFVETYGSDYTDARYLNPITGSAVWLDNDNDGWLDLALSGQPTLNTCLGYLDWNPGTNPPASYPNFTWAHRLLPGGNRGGLAVGDFDNDNRPDLFVATAPGGEVYNGFSGDYPTCLYPLGAVSGIMYGTDSQYPYDSYNTNASFMNMSAQDATLAVGDFDRSGWQDVLLTGDFYTNSGDASLEGGIAVGSVFLQNNLAGGRNLANSSLDAAQLTNNAMVLFNSSIPTLANGGGWSMGQTVLAAGDFDNDGFPDVFALDFPIDSTGTRYFGFFHNDGNGNFTPTSRYRLDPGASGWQVNYIETASCALADLNGDGHLDMVLGYQYQPYLVFGLQTNSIWLNDGHGNLTNSNIVLPQLDLANFAVGDIFNHGRNDILMVGVVPGSDYNNTIETIVLRNDGNGVFTPIVLGYFGSIGDTGHGLALADYDNDGRLDFAMTGDTQPINANNEAANFIPGTYIFRNLMNIPSNAPPAAPPNLSTTVGNGTVTFHWGNATDDITPANLLTYNLRVGTNSLGTQTVSPLANVTTGWRKIAAPGNCGHTTNILYRFPPGTYYWSVQAVDGGFKGGAWAPEQTFTITNAEPVTLALNQPTSNDLFNAGGLYFYGLAAALDSLTWVNVSSNVLNVTSNTLNLSWPARFKGWTVEQTTNLANPVWVTNTTPVGTLDDEWSLLVTNNAGPIYFRLVK